eukprot:TRINITY_DN1503_c0_g1_i1.p1 TRINITY_DN1503_c0_g1~~TRINITY_DN1503_c0_g1_i1.p1  ORF type:complete len:586 (-),score=165.54 TRINITY_DN1503_c0_g1_i1:65-1801(-)
MRETKKNTHGAESMLVTRTRALRRLQLSLGLFRRLCILKGVFPRVSKLHRNQQTFHAKDITFMNQDKLVSIFRKYRIFKRKYRNMVNREEFASAAKFKKTNLPEMRLDHLVKERYPTFVDALRDLDDALCLIYAFAGHQAAGVVHQNRIADCARIAREWEAYLVHTRSLKKCFLSIKGIYYQAEVQGQKITWIAPYSFAARPAQDVDYKVMMTFLDFYQTLMGFVLFRLYSSLGLSYPPPLDNVKDSKGQHLSAIVLQPLSEKVQQLSSKKKRVDASQPSEEKLSLIETVIKSVQEQEKKAREERLLQEGKIKKPEEVAPEPEETTPAPAEAEETIASLEFAKLEAEANKPPLFKGFKVFLSREVPHFSLEFVLRSNGAEVSWDGEVAPFPERDDEITHQIVDRDNTSHSFLGRDYVQPQWVYDCVNEGVILPIDAYLPGRIPPPHLSPFVNDEKEGYTPLRRIELDKFKSGEPVVEEEVVAPESDQELDDKEMEEKYSEELKKELGKAASTKGKAHKLTKKRELEIQLDRERERRMIMMPSKKKFLYKRLKRNEDIKDYQNKKLMKRRVTPEKKEKN